MPNIGNILLQNQVKLTGKLVSFNFNLFRLKMKELRGGKNSERQTRKKRH
jgi:hypothetical protein